LHCWPKRFVLSQLIIPGRGSSTAPHPRARSVDHCALEELRRSINTQTIISAETRHVITVGQCWPGDRNDVIVARHTIAHLLTGQNVNLGDGGYRDIKSITTPRRDDTGRIIHDDDYRLHRRIRARVEHVIARLKDWQILRQCRRRGHAINDTLHIVAGLWNLKTHHQLRVIS
jgi:hypothetical protein